jgi:hypothetical protein
MKTTSLKAGQALLVATIIFLVISLTVIFGLITPVVKQLKISRQLLVTRQSFFLAEAGVEDVTYRLITGQPVGTTETLSLAGSVTTTLTSDTQDGKEIISTADVQEAVRKIRSELVLGEGMTFYYGVQVGTGGFVFSNNSGVNGNIYSNANVSGANGAFVTGSVSAVGTINNLRIGTGTTGDALASTVTNSTIRGKLYCETGSGNVGATGTNKPCDTSLDEPEAQPYPITDAQIQGWKDDAVEGGIFVGDKNLTGTSNILGPLKIQGNLTLANNSKLLVQGTLWVTGTIALSNNAEVVLDPGYGTTDGVIVVEGTTALGNGSLFTGSGQQGSFVMLLSLNTSTQAITLYNNTGSVLLYAPYGTIEVSNNANLQQVTAKTLSLANGAIITYTQGIINAVFSSGPSGGYQILSWGEIE